MSNKLLTAKSNLCKHLLPGDVLADQGFDIAEMVAVSGAVIHISSFTKGKVQLSAAEVHNTRKIANFHIHVERVAGNVWQKYSIFLEPCH